MFKKIFIGCIVTLSLLAICINATTPVMKFSMPKEAEKYEHEIHSGIGTSLTKNIPKLEKHDLNCNYYPLDGYKEAQKEIETKSQNIQNKYNEIKNEMN